MWLMMKLQYMTCILLQLGKTALYWATAYGHVQVVETLIRLGADVNALDKVVCDEVLVLLVRSTIQCSKDTTILPVCVM